MTWLVTIGLSLLMMVGLFLILWGAVGFVQNKKFFTSAPKDVQAAIEPKEERFKGQRVVGWVIMILGLLLLIGPIVFGVYDGVIRGFGYWMFFARLSIMLVSQKVFDILFFDLFLLCHSNFFPHYYPETKGLVGPHQFGFNYKSHIVQTIILIGAAFLLAFVGTLF
ncbi:MAG: hypothetical protein IJ735_01495 [Clostridia bacterium]|nr:hypothetical protein [Clostridia bacterium]